MCPKGQCCCRGFKGGCGFQMGTLFHAGGADGRESKSKSLYRLGISGSIQHFAGMKTSGMVIAINTDENAAIISNCDYFVVADALEIIPALTKILDNG